MKFCDAVLIGEIPSWKDSGVHREMEMAKELGLPIYYDLKEIPDEI